MYNVLLCNPVENLDNIRHYDFASHISPSTVGLFVFNESNLSDIAFLLESINWEIDDVILEIAPSEGFTGSSLNGVILARFKSQKKYTYAESVKEFGTGALNVRGEVSSINGVKSLRFPSNVLFHHHQLCRRMGDKTVKSSKPVAIRAGGNYFWNGTDGREFTTGYGDDSGTETVIEWDCHESCPCRTLADQSGASVSKLTPRGKYGIFKGINPIKSNVEEKSADMERFGGYDDNGSADRFFTQTVGEMLSSGLSSDFVQYFLWITKPPLEDAALLVVNSGLEVEALAVAAGWKSVVCIQL